MAVSKSMSMLAIATLGLLASSGAVAEASYSETIRLVRSMREDEMIMAGLQAKFAQEIKAGNGPQHASCVAQLKYPMLTGLIASGISPRLSDAEVAEAIQFYRSPVGRKFLERGYQELAQNLPPDPDHLSTEEKVALGKFGKRPVGRKLLQDRITLSEPIMQKAMMRLKMAFDDCVTEIEGIEGVIVTKTCTTAPVVTSDNACYVEQVLEGYPKRPAEDETSIRARCSGDGRGHSYPIARYQGHVKNIDLRWLDARTVEVTAPTGAKPVGDVRPGEVRAQFKQLPAAKIKPQQCWNDVSSLHLTRIDMDELLSQTYWMSYGEAGRCLLSKRIEMAQLPGANRNSVVQFRRVKSPEYPYATDQLVFFETFSTQVNTRSVRVRGAGIDDVELKPGGRIAGFQLVGAHAETVLKQLASGTKLTLEVQPAAGAAFTIPLDTNDLAWAHQDFATCLNTL
ncbi:DUF2059 domain-containing protein [Steroidobacter sp.]|uniref:DUF2059 domain-containing protein n=1 Tax=Steroidobacter sp. TaxID=1978227 RepID=UPI002ED7C835